MTTLGTAIVLLLLAMLTFPLPVRAQQKADVTTTFFWSLHQEFSERMRHTQILRKCGYKKEADEIEAHVMTLGKKRLDAPVEDGIKHDKLSSMGALFVAREGAHGLWVGYAMGFRVRTPSRRPANGQKKRRNDRRGSTPARSPMEESPDGPTR